MNSRLTFPEQSELYGYARHYSDAELYAALLNLGAPTADIESAQYTLEYFVISSKIYSYLKEMYGYDSIWAADNFMRQYAKFVSKLQDKEENMA